MQDDQHGESPRKHIKLPTIAPKDDQRSTSTSTSTSTSRGGRATGPPVPPRVRLPPRSRTGCWTCRQRKVKCDEGRPVCNQCARLGHACDYSPRLSFRDDTARVVERMQDVTVSSGSVWDGQSPCHPMLGRTANADTGVASPTPSSPGSTPADDLPPFAQLLTDDEREAKAKASSPGTYNVVVNPDSFQHLPEYSSEDFEPRKDLRLPFRRSSVAASLTSSVGRDGPGEGVSGSGDPNVVVLPRFEDLSRKSTRELRSPISPTTRGANIKVEDSDGLPLSDDEDLKILDHFRQHVWPQLVPTETLETSSVVLLDSISADFSPLRYVMMAVASQSLAQRDGRESYYALQHYTQALDLLKTEGDLGSDGVFLTHFLMLVYEIAMADTEHSQIREHHLSALLRMAYYRRARPGGETFPYIIWWLCKIDLGTLFSGAGSGGLVTNLLEHEAVPPPSFHLYPLGDDGSSMVFADERATLPQLLQLDYEITLLAIRLAALAQEFRLDVQFGSLQGVQRDMAVRLRQSRLYEIQDALRQLWIRPAIMNLGQSPLAARPRRIWEHAFSLYSACLIYLHTSMWPAQRLDTPPDFIEEISRAATEILQLAQGTIYDGHTECRFLVLPILLAGFASTNGAEKKLALDLVDRMQHDSVGRNTAATWTALQAIYQRQNQQFRDTGNSDDVDWFDVISQHRLTIVHFGL